MRLASESAPLGRSALAAPSAARTWSRPRPSLPSSSGLTSARDARPRTAAHGHLPDAWYLGNLLRQNGVSHVVELRSGGGIRSHRDTHDVNFGGVYLAPVRIRRQVRRQLPARRVNGRLYIPPGGVHVAIEVKLHRDIRTAELTDGGHLRYAGDAAEHPLERSGHRAWPSFRGLRPADLQRP